MTSKTIYSIVAVFAALLIISASVGVYYYYELGLESQSKNQYINELTTATSRYNQLASNYNSSLLLYNKTFSLLVRAIAVVNTSQSIYQQASSELSQLWSSYLKLKPASSSLYTVNILFDFGNGTRHWYNSTEVQPGWNMYIATVVLTNGNLQAQWYPQYQEHFVSGISGVSNSKTMFWFLWTHNKTASWQTAQVGADNLPVYNGSVFAWTFCGQTSSYAPTCRP